MKLVSVRAVDCHRFKAARSLAVLTLQQNYHTLDDNEGVELITRFDQFDAQRCVPTPPIYESQLTPVPLHKAKTQKS
jgi:hypothetical protein